MARLTGLKARIGGLPPRLAPLDKQPDRFYLSEAWREKRREKLAQGPAYCCMCGKGNGSGKGLILDHRHERSDGGADLPPVDELDWYCHGDHNRKTAAARAARAVGRPHSGSGRGK